MTSERKKKRNRIGKIQAYRLRQAGFTNSQIAEQLGIPKEKVASRVALGERLASLSDDKGE